MQHVAGAQRAARVSAEPPQREGARAAQIFGNIEAPGHKDVRANARTSCIPPIRAAAPAGARVTTPAEQPARHRARAANRRRPKRNRVSQMKAQRRPVQRAFQTRRAFVISQQAIAETERQANPSGPKAARRLASSRAAPGNPAPWSGAAVEHFDGARFVRKRFQKARGHATAREMNRWRRFAAGSRGWFRFPRSSRRSPALREALSTPRRRVLAATRSTSPAADRRTE